MPRGAVRLVALAMVALASSIGCGLLQAGQERYDYDALGRLVRVIDEQGRVTEYVYDAAGNLLQVVTSTQSAPPAISSIQPSNLRRGEAKQFQIAGTGLTNARVGTSDPGLEISGLSISAVKLSFSLTAGLAAALGPQSLTVSNAAGSAATSVTVNPALPKFAVEPVPLAIPPDNQPHAFTVRLSNADTVDHVIALSLSNQNASVTPAQLTFPAGQTTAQATIAGVTAGQATLTLTSPTLGSSLVPIYITGEFRGLDTSYAPLVGVVVQSSTHTSRDVGPIVGRSFGVVVGGAVTAVTPNRLVIGSGPATLTISGVGLGGAANLVVSPADGVSLGSMTIASDGTFVTVPITVSTSAPLGVRRAILSSSTGVAFQATAPDADRFSIVRPAPTVESVDPLFGVPGNTLTLTVRGQNLQQAQSVSMAPVTGLTVDATPSVSADGRTLTVGVGLALNAPVGQRTVVVTTPGGSSSATPSPNNTFTVANQITGNVTPVTAPAVGVVLQQNQSTSVTRDAYSTLLGVSMGSVVSTMTPASGVVGQSLTLTLQGDELQGVTSVQLSPATGLTVGSPSVSTDGRTVSVPVTIAPDAPQTYRAVQVSAGTTAIPFASPAASRFLVTLPVPVVDSISPNVLALGQSAVALTLRGRNFQNASQVQMLAPDGLSVSVPPSVSADGTQAVVNVTVSPTAATGQRAVVIATAAGQSPSALSPFNTLTLTAQPAPIVTPITARALGVLLQNGTAPPPTSVGPIVASPLGVLLQGAPGPATRDVLTLAPQLGVAVGPVVTSIAPSALAPGANVTLVIRGNLLSAAVGVSAVPGTGLSFGTLQVSLDGTQVSVPVSVAANAPAIAQTLVLTTASGAAPAASPSAALLQIGPGVPTLDSISPILAAQGQTITLTIRGQRFNGATAVIATPGTGLTFASTPSVSADGTVLTIGVAIAPNAPLGSSMIQVLVAGAASSSTATPANTFTVTSP